MDGTCEQQESLEKDGSERGRIVEISRTYNKRAWHSEGKKSRWKLGLTYLTSLKK